MYATEQICRKEGRNNQAATLHNLSEPAAGSGSGAAQPLSSDNDPLFALHRWKTNLCILGIEEIKTVPIVSISHRTSHDDSDNRV